MENIFNLTEAEKYFYIILCITFFTNFLILNPTKTALIKIMTEKRTEEINEILKDKYNVTETKNPNPPLINALSNYYSMDKIENRFANLIHLIVTPIYTLTNLFFLTYFPAVIWLWAKDLYTYAVFLFAWPIVKFAYLIFSYTEWSISRLLTGRGSNEPQKFKNSLKKLSQQHQ